MKKCDKTIQAFYALLQAGLWRKEVQLLPYGDVDYELICQLAEEQSVTGLIAAGFDQVKDNKPPKDLALQMIGQTLQIEQCNKEMNQFVASLVEMMRNAGIYTLLLKGQGIAQCYERPLWRACGDVDFFLSDDNYGKAKEFLLPLASDIETEVERSKHLGMTIDGWVVELHGTLRCGLSRRIDKGLDGIQNDTFYGDLVRSWMDGKTQIFLPDVTNDAVYVFTHILSHFYKGGIGIRQICDWCRLLWTYREMINRAELEKKVRAMGMASAWRTFGAFAVEYLSMPVEAMPLFDSKVKGNQKFKRKAKRVGKFIIKTGSFGHNRDMSYYSTKPYLVRKAISMGRRIGDMRNHFCIFPVDTLRFFPNITVNGLRSAINGE